MGRHVPVFVWLLACCACSVMPTPPAHTCLRTLCIYVLRPRLHPLYASCLSHVKSLCVLQLCWLTCKEWWHLEAQALKGTTRIGSRACIGLAGPLRALFCYLRTIYLPANHAKCHPSSPSNLVPAYMSRTSTSCTPPSPSRNSAPLSRFRAGASFCFTSCSRVSSTVT